MDIQRAACLIPPRRRVWRPGCRQNLPHPQGKMIKRVSGLFLVSVLFLCAGCVSYHSGLAANSPRDAINDRTLKSIIVGSTTIEDVLLRLGEPQEHYDAPTVFLYRWVWVSGLSMITQWGLSRLEEKRTVEYTLHIAFDENNKVSRYKVSE